MSEGAIRTLLYITDLYYLFWPNKSWIILYTGDKREQETLSSEGKSCKSGYLQRGLWPSQEACAVKRPWYTRRDYSCQLKAVCSALLTKDITNRKKKKKIVILGKLWVKQLTHCCVWDPSPFCFSPSLPAWLAAQSMGHPGPFPCSQCPHLGLTKDQLAVL